MDLPTPVWPIMRTARSLEVEEDGDEFMLERYVRKKCEKSQFESRASQLNRSREIQSDRVQMGYGYL